MCDLHVLHAAHVVPRNETAKHPTDHIDTCLGDLYSVGWIELAERYNLHHWSLQKEFERVRNRTSNHHTFEYVCLPMPSRTHLHLHCTKSQPSLRFTVLYCMCRVLWCIF